jgi:hypothetical protein
MLGAGAPDGVPVRAPAAAAIHPDARIGPAVPWQGGTRVRGRRHERDCIRPRTATRGATAGARAGRGASRTAGRQMGRACSSTRPARAPCSSRRRQIMPCSSTPRAGKYTGTGTRIRVLKTRPAARRCLLIGATGQTIAHDNATQVNS